MFRMEYQVKPGDCISSLARQYGFLWKTIWDANPDLKSKRRKPNLLMPGDVVIVPDRTLKEVSCATDQCHTFIELGETTKLRLVLERFNVALANRRYILTCNGVALQGATDNTGMLEVSIDAAAEECHLQMPDDDLECIIRLGHLDPIEETSGVQQRLHNLGFYLGDLDAVDQDDIAEALAAFQSSANLDVTGKLDDATRQKLFDMHDKRHPQVHMEDTPLDDDTSGTDSQEVIDAPIDPAQDEQVMARLTALDD